jgi:hypothetical protein
LRIEENVLIPYSEPSGHRIRKIGHDLMGQPSDLTGQQVALIGKGRPSAA